MEVTKLLGQCFFSYFYTVYLMGIFLEFHMYRRSLVVVTPVKYKNI